MSTITPRAASLVSPSTRRFARHYAEMLVAMFGGMIVLGMPAVAALGAAGMSRTELRSDHPTLLLLGMGVVMTVPMVAWMRHRGHSWRPSLEMAASMLLPTLGVLVVLWTGAVEDIGTLLGIEHVVMLPSMLVAMLLRREEYTGDHHHHDARHAMAAA